MNKGGIFEELVESIKNNKAFSVLLKKYISYGFDINYQNEYGNTLLHIACRTRNYDALCILLDNGASVNQTNNDNRTPLHMAVIYGIDSMNGLMKKEHDISNKIIALLIQYNRHTITIVDKDMMDPMDYYIKLKNNNPVFESVKRNYKIKNMFYKMLMETQDINEYEETIQIINLIKQ